MTMTKIITATPNPAGSDFKNAPLESTIAWMPPSCLISATSGMAYRATCKPKILAKWTRLTRPWKENNCETMLLDMTNLTGVKRPTFGRRCS